MQRTFILNADNFDDLSSFYIAIYSLMTLYEDWQPAHNLDALNDMLYSGFGTERLTLVWQNSTKSKAELGLEATKEFYHKKIEQGKPYNVEWAQKKLNELETGVGQTLFDIIVEIIRDHKNISLLLEDD